MDIAAPPGYSKLVALDSEQHRGFGVVSRRQSFAATLTGVYVSVVEFIQAARHYPLVFARDESRDAFVPLAVTGLEQGINLFVGADGTWNADAYVPAYVRCWPFHGARLTGAGAKPGKFLICVDPQGLERSGTPLFGPDGKPGAVLSAAQSLIRELEAARDATGQLCRSVQELELLTPFEAHALPKRGSEWRVRGMYRVDETRLNALDGGIVKRLMQSGELSRIYAHLMSLDNFKFLMDRAVARKAASASEPVKLEH